MSGDPFKTERDDGVALSVLLAAEGFEGAEEIGSGGFGVVYRCVQVELDRVVAVKVLTVDLEDSRPRFLREQQAMAKLTGHPNIVAVLQVGQTARGHPFLVMPLYARDSLQALICQTGIVALGEVLRIGVKIAGALESAHRLEIVHRDIKPANILLTEYGAPALTDFGIARLTEGFKTATGVFTGSPAYTAPEVLSGQPAVKASDVYGLGATLFTALTGHAAFERRKGEEVVAQFVRITSEPLPDLRREGMSSDVAALIAAAMARDPAQRPTALQFGESLQQLQAAHGFAVDEMALLGGGPRRAARQLPRAGSARSAVGRLPLPAQDLPGCEADLARVRRLLSGSRLVTVTGFAGVGKTALASVAAAELTADVPDGAWWVDLRDLGDGGPLPEVVRTALGLPGQSGRTPTDVVIDFLKARRALLVFDSCERAIDDAATLVETLLGACPHVRVLATAREPLHIGGEEVLQLTMLGPYRLDQLIGRGDMAEVYRAYDTRADRTVALEVLPAYLTDEAVFAQRFRRAAKAAATIDEPHVVPIHGFGEINGRLYLDMRLIEGRSLEAGLRSRSEPLDAAFAVAVVEQAAAALDAAHAAGLVHGDLRPSKFLITESDFVYLIDFGMARGIDDSGRVAGGRTLGATAYLAPECFHLDSVGPSSDIYSLACVLYECLTGMRPHAADNLEQPITGRTRSSVPCPSATDPALAPFDDVIAKGLADKPADRYESAGQLAAAARLALDSPMPAGRRVRRRAAARRTPLRRRVVAVAAAAFLLATTAIGAWAWRGGGNGGDGSAGADSRSEPGAVPEIAATLPAAIRQSGRLVIGSDWPNAPFAFENSHGGLDGFDVELMNAVARTLGVVPDYRKLESESIIPAVEKGALELGAAALTDTREREKVADFVTYFRAGSLWAQRPGQTIDPNGACGLRVGVKTGGFQDTDELPAKSAVCVAAGFAPIDKVVFTGQDELVAALIGGKVDAMSADSPVTDLAIKLSAGALVAAGDIVDSAPHGWPVAKGSALSDSLRQALAHVIGTGEYQTIAAKWGLEEGMIDKPVLNGATE